MNEITTSRNGKTILVKPSEEGFSWKTNYKLKFQCTQMGDGAND